MTATSAPAARARKSILFPAILAGIFCAGALAALVFLPASFYSEENAYFTANGPRITSISVNAFFADYHQRTRTLDHSEDMAKKGFTTVNTIGWSIESRRLAAVLAVPAILLVMRVVKRDRAR